MESEAISRNPLVEPNVTGSAGHIRRLATNLVPFPVLFLRRSKTLHTPKEETHRDTGQAGGSPPSGKI